MQMNNKDLTIIIYDHIDSRKYQVECVPQYEEYKQKVVYTIPELEKVLEEELTPTDRICFFIHAMTDQNYNMVEGELDVEDNNPNKPGGVLKRKFKNLYVNYVTTGSPWFAIDKYRQRFVFNYNHIEEHISKNDISPQRVCEFYTHKNPYKQLPSKADTEQQSDNFLQDEENLDRPLAEIKPAGFALDGIKTFLKDFNKTFVFDKIRFKNFDTSNHWSNCLFNFLSKDSSNPLISETWNYKSDVFTSLLETEKLEIDDKPNPDDSTLIVDCENAEENIQYFGKCEKNNKDHQWEIKMNFFVSLVGREFFLKEDKSPDYEKISIATRLYLMHEILHKQFHDLDYRRADGIGSFPRVIEEADFHADAFAILCEISHQLDINSDLNFIYKQVKTIIKSAIETTLSFGRKGITEIQVRRVNRYLIWLYILRRINLFIEKNPKSSTEQLIGFIVKLISVKPILEITGPEIFSNKTKDRVSYRIDKAHITLREQLCLMDDEKRIVLKPRSDFENYELLYSGLSDSKLENLYKFIEQVL